MGNSESVDVPGGGTDGYHVLKVQENSPASIAGLQPFFDFIISINGTRLDRENDTLRTILKNGLGKQLPLTIYSYKTQSVRTVTVVPSDTWGGQGYLGVSIKFCSFDVAKEIVWHILEVHPNSPASLANLRPFSDYIIGADSILHESEDLYNLIENHDGVPLKFYVYNSDDDTCRDVTITPNSKWGGDGMLGCGIGYGYLHRIPVRGSAIQPPPTTTIFNQVPTISPSNDQSASPATTQPITNLIQKTENLNLEATGQAVQDTHVTNVLSTAASTIQQDPTVYTSNVPAPSSIPNFNMNFQNPPASNDIPSFDMNKFSNPQNPVTSEAVVHPQVSLQSPQPIITPTMYNPADYPAFSPAQPSTQTTVPVYSYPQMQSSGAPTNVLHTTPNSSLPPPPLSGFLNQPIIFDPHIAAQSAQQLLSGTVTTSSS
ncbi:unnamed protein product [Diabrotica balteata]|uniref:PDZ GRASP-type domain-containing protein n=1 Tax=Diabrotica balteata TaxID=107213 RepID=A0A9N9SNP7_DIABA|nr:unnamed protein product [Diabrotica balteata]